MNQLVVRCSQLAVFAVLAGACGSGDSGLPDEASVRDSAGITIHEYPAGTIDRLPELQFDPEPLAVIGGPMDDDLTGMMDGIFLGDGSLAVTIGRAGQRVRIFGPSGAERSGFGGPGAGPGEFRMMSGLAWLPGDTLAVADATLGKVTLAHPDGGVIREIPSELNRDGRGFGVLGRMENGAWLMRIFSQVLAMQPVGASPGDRPPLPIMAGREGPDGRLTLDTFAMARDAAPGRYAPVALHTIWNGRLAVADNAAWQIVRYSMDGSPDMIIRTGDRMVPFTSEMRDTLVAVALRRWDGMTEAQRGPTTREVTRTRWMEMKYADSIMVFRALVGSNDGSLMAVQFPSPLDSTVTRVLLDSDGRFVGRLVLPLDVNVLAATSERLALRTVDPDGFEVVTIRKIVTPASRTAVR